MPAQRTAGEIRIQRIHNLQPYKIKINISNDNNTKDTTQKINQKNEREEENISEVSEEKIK
jgi:hypothetical protein